MSFAVVAISLAIASVRGQDAKFVDDNLKFSREFYAKVHFVAVSSSPGPFKYDRYPDKGAERFQCEDGTYLRQYGQSWKHVDQPMRVGLPTVERKGAVCESCGTSFSRLGMHIPS
jgi:hypothetical protein